MAYTYDALFAVDPNSPNNIARNASILLFDPNDPAKTPVTLTDVTDVPVPNPIQVNQHGFGPAIKHATLDRLAWEGAGMSGVFTSYEGLKEEAVAAREAAVEAFGYAVEAAGEAVAAATVNPAGDLILTRSNGEMANAGSVRGPKGDTGDKGLDGSNVLPTDAAIKQAITTPGTETATALNSTYGPTAQAGSAPMKAAFASAKDASVLRLLSNVASADRQKSVADSRAAYEDAASFAETWANQTAWAFTAGKAQVSGGKLYSLDTGGASTNHTLPFTGKVRARAILHTVSGGTSKWTGFGFTKAGAGATPTSTQMAWIGARGDGYIVAYDHEGIHAPTPGIQLTTGSYYITAYWDGTQISFTITNANGQTEWRWQVPTTFGAPTGLLAWAEDERTTGGNAIGAITARAGNVTHPTRTVENAAPSVIYAKDSGGQNIHIALPASYDSRKPVPLILVAHGNNGDALTPLFGSTAQKTFYSSALADGYAVASSDMHGSWGTWGSPTSVTDLLNLYRYVKANYAIGPVVLLGESAGGATMFNALSQRVLPEVAAAIFWYPVANLAEEYNNHNFSAPIKSAYGVASLADIDQNVYSPVNLPGYAFRGVPMRVYASAGDTVVPTALNSQIVIDKAKDFAPEATIVVTTGDHGHSSNFQWADAKAFLAKYVAG